MLIAVLVVLLTSHPSQLCHSEQKEWHAAQKRYVQVEDIKRKMDDLGHDGKWSVAPGKGKKGRLSPEVRLDPHFVTLCGDI
jgi:hypothetical protein